jgi:hypothetical protein
MSASSSAIILFGLAAVSAPATPPAGWSASVNENGLRHAEVRGEAALGKLRTPARLMLQCRPGMKGSISWMLEIEHASNLKGFNFGDFEGPDAPAAGKRLSELGIEGGLMHPQVSAAQNGYFHGDRPDSFVFEVTAAAAAASDAALLADAIGPGTSGISWTVTSARDVNLRIAAHFPADDASAVVRDASAGCGPAPPLSDEAMAAWTGKDAATSGMLEQPAISWRTKATLGRDYALFRAALAKSEPVGSDVHALYIFGRNEAGVAATWVYDRQSGRDEAVLIKAGKSKRYADDDAKRIQMPDAVRAYLASAIK